MFSSKEQFKENFVARLAQREDKGSLKTSYSVLTDMVKEWTYDDWEKTNRQYKDEKRKQLYYFSIEFLMGRILGQNLMNLDTHGLVKEGLEELGFDLQAIEDQEPEPGLGNGGLGRLAACFMDSLASLQLPGHGCGLRYKGGLFTQVFHDGYQTEQPTVWIDEKKGWGIRREELSLDIPFFGSIEPDIESNRLKPALKDAEWVKAVPYDYPIVGAAGKTVNTLRLWQAEVSNRPLPKGKTRLLYEQETAAVTDRLYPDASLDAGKILRLKQQYFLCSASLQTIVKNRDCSLSDLSRHVAIQINDTHPALAIPELMRILMDEEGMQWEEAWGIVNHTISYTNHTILEEAMEKWDSYLLERLLPRVYMIIQEIDRRFREKTQQEPLDEWQRKKLAIIENGVVHMATLAVVGSYKVNGVAKLHTEILKMREMKELNEHFPHKFHNITNGVTHRRWLLKANPELSGLITSAVGDEWIQEPIKLHKLHRFSKDPAFQQDLQAVKLAKKRQLADYIRTHQNIIVDPESVFDAQIKRIHGYKRQLMNILHIQMLYNRILGDQSFRPYPRTFIFGGKAAPSYHYAKQVIKLINTVSDQVNNNPLTKKHLHVVFIEDYSVSKAEKIFPATDVSEQISTASKEASGTGNMKFMMNGAITLGTFDGANLEIVEQVGEDNAFIFGLTARQVMQFEKEQSYYPPDIVQYNNELQVVMAQLLDGVLSGGPENVSAISNQLVDCNDPFFVLKDIEQYRKAHERLLGAFENTKAWQEMSVVNIAQSGVFSSDRTIQEYADEVWQLDRVPSNLL
ncbi:MAG TPA: glycogen/starch/alpha-glucan phosphorylase [Planococcus sp. (in: firmicutes)]|nr:glycogen/starch/alpha-glucan phosphorylase [Planococcus sp. (in: firmicutes)]